jgi:hypothetical protein
MAQGLLASNDRAISMTQNVWSFQRYVLLTWLHYEAQPLTISLLIYKTDFNIISSPTPICLKQYRPFRIEFG